MIDLANPKAKNALTVDVEDYFHVTALANSIDRKDWASLESRVRRNTGKLLQMFDDASAKATFFVLGWVADRYPEVVREIVDSGHELACHGYSHRLIYKQEKAVFRDETVRAKKLLEDISGDAVLGYRAASYSITAKSHWAIEILAEAGFTYDSSIVPVSHDLYGMKGSPVFPYRIQLPDGGVLAEFPPSTIEVLGKRIPIGGGGYFRLFPYWFTRWGLNSINCKQEKPFAFYLHPWEIDPEQPRFSADRRSTFRHYNNLERCQSRLEKLLIDFEFDTMQAVLNNLPLESGECVTIENLVTAGAS